MKKYIVSLVLLILAVICFGAYNIIGSEIAPDNTLNEPFYLIPIAWLMLMSGLVSVIVIFIVSLIKRKRINK